MSLTLITGADGHVGRAVANWLLAQSDDSLLLYVRAANAAQRATKLARLGSLADSTRCRIVFGDLSEANAFDSLDAAAITRIVHAAAVTDFGVDRDTARVANVLATTQLLDFAETCPQLERFALISSLYAAGLQSGRVDEAPLEKPAEFANHYEWSKWAAERACVDRRLPWCILRLATILADDASGRVTQQNVIHNTLRLLFYGLLAVVPGDPKTRVYTVSTRYAAEAIGRTLNAPETMRVYQVAETGGAAMTLGELADVAYELFMTDDGFARHGILKPRYCDAEAFRTLVDGVGQFGGPVAQALASVAPFAAQLYSDKLFVTDNTVALLPDFDEIEPAALLRAVGRHLIATRWDRQREEQLHAN